VFDADVAADRAPGAVLTSRRRPSLLGFDALDGLVLVALVAAASWTRRYGLPDDGLWFDDSWVGAGPVKGSASQLLIVQSGHPGFSALLMGVSRIWNGSSVLGGPAFVAGILGPVALYLVVRAIGFARPIGALVAAALVVADVPILYAGRVKTYTIDLLIVAAIMLVLPRVVRVTWRWRMAIGWTAAAFIVGSVSGFAMAATATAALVVVAHSRSDLRYRLGALGAQALAQYSLVQILHARSNLEDLEASQEIYDGHLEWEWNPISFVGQVLRHLRRIAVVYPGGTKWSTLLLAVVAVAGLALASLTGRVRVRYAGALMLVTFAGAFFSVLPFGPDDWYWKDSGLPPNPLSRGERGSIWLVPAIAIGLAAALHLVRRLVATGTRRRTAFDVVLWAGAAGLVLFGLGTTPPRYPLPGNASATAYIESELTDGDVVLLTSTSIYSFLVETTLATELHATPDRHIGYTPEFTDAPIYTFGGFGQHEARPREVRSLTETARRVLLMDSIPGLGGLEVEPIVRGLRSGGFNLERVERFGAVEVMVFER